MVKANINNEDYKVTLERRSDGGVDFCIETWKGSRCICNLTNCGELMLYADVPEELSRTKTMKYITVFKEMG